MIAKNMNAIPNHEFKNVLGLLSPKDNFKLRPKRLLEVTGYSKAALSKEIKSSRPLMYREEVDLRTMKQLREGVFQLVTASDLIFELFKFNDAETKEIFFADLSEPKRAKLQGETERWLMSPNQILFGKSPFEVCISGNGKELIRWLSGKLGYEPIDVPN